MNGQALALPKPNPSIVTVFGDTGCRINASQVQDCNDSGEVAVQASRRGRRRRKTGSDDSRGRLSLSRASVPGRFGDVVRRHAVGRQLGDLERRFLRSRCEIIGRRAVGFRAGNHEDCARSWRGWFYYFDPRPWDGMCQPFSPPYTVKLGAFQLVILDSSEVLEDSMDQNQISHYASQLASLHVKNAWLVAHHPFWGFKAGLVGQALRSHFRASGRSLEQSRAERHQLDSVGPYPSVRTDSGGPFAPARK